jgi:hypothetical protein
LDDLVEKFVFVFLGEILELHPRQTRERLTRGNGLAETVILVTGQYLIREFVELDVFGALAGNLALEFNGLLGRGGPRLLLLSRDACYLLVGDPPFFE